MLASTSAAIDNSPETDVYPHARILSWLASLCVAGGHMRAADAYLTELLAICVFADRVVDETSD
jgi:hypothetical protein